MGIHGHSMQVLESIRKQNDIFEVVGYVLPKSEKEHFSCMRTVLEGLKELTLEEVLDNPEITAVTIETDEQKLCRVALAAAEHKKHVHMEKPGGAQLWEMERLIETARKNGIILHMGYMYRYNPFIQEIIDRAKRGELGEVFSVEAQMNCRHTPEVRQWLANFKGGIMFYLGCHLIDLILQIQGVPEKIIPLNKSTGIDGVTAEDFGMVVFEYAHGISFVKTCAEEKGGYARRQLVVTGSERTIELKPLEMCAEAGIYTGKTEYTSAIWENMGDYSQSRVFDRYDDMMASFAHMVNGKKQNPYTYDYELQLYRTLLECCGS